MEYSSHVHHAFVLKPETLRSLWTFVDLHIGEDRSPTATLECSDDSKREFQCIEGLLTFRNPSSAKIRKLRLRGYSKDTNDSFRIAFDAVSVFVSLDASDATAPGLYQQLTDLVGATRPWYSFLSRWMFTVNLILGLGYVAVLTLYANDAMSAEWFGGSTKLLASSMGLNLARVPLFPYAYFALGDGKERHNVREAFRMVAIAVVLGAVATVVLT